MSIRPALPAILVSSLALLAAVPLSVRADEATPATAPAATSAEKPYEYLIGPSDLLFVSIRAGGGEASDLKLRVAGDGTIAVPYIGTVKAGGLTTQQVRATIERRLREGGFFTTPHASVNVEEYLSQGVNVGGYVTTQGRFYLRGPTHLLDILSLAGGVIEAEAGDVIRITRSGLVEPMRIRRSQLYGSDVEAARQANILMAADDNVYVPRKAVFCILGPVKNPDCYPLEDGMTILQAISVAGGLDVGARREDITIKRRGVDGAQEIKVDLDAVDRGTAAPLLEPDDQVIVGQVERTSFCVTGPVMSPDCYDFERTLTLEEALSKAGGLDVTRADRHRIVVRRPIGDQFQEIVLDLDDAGERGARFGIRSKDQVTVGEAQLMVTVSGSVKEPGDVKWRPGLTITDAIADRGGAEAADLFGKLTNVLLRREGEPIRTINVKAIMRGAAEDVLLQPGDRITVQRKQW